MNWNIQKHGATIHAFALKTDKRGTWSDDRYFYHCPDWILQDNKNIMKILETPNPTKKNNSNI